VREVVRFAEEQDATAFEQGVEEREALGVHFRESVLQAGCIPLDPLKEIPPLEYAANDRRSTGETEDDTLAPSCQRAMANVTVERCWGIQERRMSTMPYYTEIDHHELPGGSSFWSGWLPSALVPDAETFDALWRLHPEDHHIIQIHGRLVPTPRWQQAYGVDYHYTGRTNRAAPMPATLEPFVDWVREQIDPRLNGALVNWYDGSLGHYIGRHRDSRRSMLLGAPIVTISLGERRTFRLRRWRGDERLDFPTANGTVFIMPYATNLEWTHEIPKSQRARERRISLTLRALGTAGTALHVGETGPSDRPFA
jgi:alkylated DNA repair dioxygenase AlkB